MTSPISLTPSLILSTAKASKPSSNRSSLEYRASARALRPLQDTRVVDAAAISLAVPRRARSSLFRDRGATRAPTRFSPDRAPPSLQVRRGAPPRSGQLAQDRQICFLRPRLDRPRRGIPRSDPYNPLKILRPRLTLDPSQSELATSTAQSAPSQR